MRANLKYWTDLKKYFSINLMNAAKERTIENPLPRVDLRTDIQGVK